MHKIILYCSTYIILLLLCRPRYTFSGCFYIFLYLQSLVVKKQTHIYAHTVFYVYFLFFGRSNFTMLRRLPPVYYRYVFLCTFVVFPLRTNNNNDDYYNNIIQRRKIRAPVYFTILGINIYYYY